jgi:hypothetical protein
MSSGRLVRQSGAYLCAWRPATGVPGKVKVLRPHSKSKTTGNTSSRTYCGKSIHLRCAGWLRSRPEKTFRIVATKAQVVARSLDLATRLTEGLQSRLERGDLRSSARRGLETRVEPSPARNPEVFPVPSLDLSAPMRQVCARGAEKCPRLYSPMRLRTSSTNSSSRSRPTRR